MCAMRPAYLLYLSYLSMYVYGLEYIDRLSLTLTHKKEEVKVDARRRKYSPSCVVADRTLSCSLTHTCIETPCFARRRNAYQVNTGSQLAMFYNDMHGAPPLPSRLPSRPPARSARSRVIVSTAVRRAGEMHRLKCAPSPGTPHCAVLENHHCHLCFQLLESVQLLDAMPPKKRRTLRQLIVDAILHTDMARHKMLVDQLQRRGADEHNPMRRDSLDDRMLLARASPRREWRRVGHSY